MIILPEWDGPGNILDGVITSDEYDHFRYLVWEALRECEVQGGQLPLPFMVWFTAEMKEKLISAGFDKKTLEDSGEMQNLLTALDNAGRPWKNTRFDIYPPDGLPPGTYELGPTNNIFWVKPEIEAAIRALKSITEVTELLVKDGEPNYEAVKVYLHTMALTISLIRAGVVPKLAVSESEKKAKSIESRELKKQVMTGIIDNIFKKYPHRPKTLGEVWNKLDRGYEGIRLRKTRKEYIATTAKDEKGKDIVKIVGDVDKPMTYSKRSLQRFIDETKKNPLP